MVNLTLLTDLYEVTMAYGYWKSGMAETEAVFHLSFRSNPFGGGYSIACGLEPAVEWLEAFSFDADALQYLATLAGNDGRPLFDESFLDYLGDLRMSCDVDAIPEGTIVFPHEPLVRVRGSLLVAQLVESALLNIVNFQTLIATKSARICDAAGGDPVLEFGLRRAQGVDGALAASRAAFVGGCAATSNVLAGKMYGIPVAGTHAHSWVMSFDDELTAFATYADAMPNNTVLLVDTFETLDGVRHAIEIGRRLRERGHQLAGIRLDSGDLAYLSIEARKLLDAAGFHDAAIYASNDLDEETIVSLNNQHAAINRWGVGTRLVTGHGQPALGGVYKLGAIRTAQGWERRIKLSEQTAKTSIPGVLGVRRYTTDGVFAGDMIYDELTAEPIEARIIDPSDPTRSRTFDATAQSEELLVPVFRRGERVWTAPSLVETRERTRAGLALLHPTIRRFLNPHRYPVGLEPTLHARRTQMILDARNTAEKTKRR